MINILDYQIINILYESPNSFVYRAHQKLNQQPVILKVLKENYPAQIELTRYRSEYDILTHLKSIDGVIKVHALEKYFNALVMVLEDFGGESLKNLISSQSLTLETCLNIMIKLTHILGQIHATHIIHKNINPSNIIINNQTDQIKFIDFGISSVFSHEGPFLKNTQMLEGSLAYISPEQTGRMNRVLDYRTDFYSLGITFYELLTQQKPFMSQEVVELIHCHMAKQPIPPRELRTQVVLKDLTSNQEMPRMVSDLIMKLLAKTPEKRYQNARHLEIDLQNCLHQWQTYGNIQSFPLGENDISDTLQISQKLYGRKAEIETLESAFQRVSQGNTEMMLIVGYSGIGKSALVQEIYKPLTQSHGYFISGKFAPLQNVPYFAVISAFSELVRQLLTESETQLKQWQTKLSTALEPNAQMIIEVIPEIEWIIGSQPPVQALDSAAAQNLFNLTFQKFINVFCQPEHPLVIFLDDLQWVDSATLQLIQLIITDNNMAHLFLIGAYRENEVDLYHPLTMTLNELCAEGMIIKQLNIKALTLEQITQLIIDSLQSEPQKVLPLAELIWQKTAGNPFFINQFLKTLYEEKWLYFDFKQGQWQWDIEKIQQVDITDNVVELMIQKLKKLPEATQHVLRLAACMGNRFDLKTLATIYEQSTFDTFQIISPALDDGLIQPLSQLEVSSPQETEGPLLIYRYQFLHDRVQQAAYSLIEDSQKKTIHLQIGRLLLANHFLQDCETKCFEVVDHLNRGQALITDPAEKIQLASLNLKAAQKAKYAVAYQAAKQYLVSGLACLSSQSWHEDYELTLALYKEQTEIEYLNGHFENSEALVHQIVKQSQSVLDQAQIYNILIKQYTLQAHYHRAIDIGRQALKLLDIELPKEHLSVALKEELNCVTQHLGDKEIALLLHEPKLTDIKYQIVLELLLNMDPAAYFINQDLYAVIVLKLVNISLQYGPTSESAKGYATYGLILGSRFGDYQTGYEFALLGLKLSDRFNNLAEKCKTYSILANHVLHWVKPIKAANAINNDGYKAGLESGELQFAGYILHHQLIHSLFKGENLTHILQQLADFLIFAQKTKNILTINSLLAYQFPLFTLTAQTAYQYSFHNEAITEDQFLTYCQHCQDYHSLCLYYIAKSQVCYLLAQPTQALDLAIKAQNYLSFILGLVAVAEHYFYYSLSLTALYPTVSQSEQKQYWVQLQANQKQMKQWADNIPENFQQKYFLIEAEMAYLSEQYLDAMDFYDLAIDSADKNHFIQDEALANELAAKLWLEKGHLWLEQGYEDIARRYLKKAYYNYNIWGAQSKINELEQKYSQLLLRLPTSSSSSPTSDTSLYSSTVHSYSTTAQLLDLATVLKASQAIMSEIILDKLLAKLMIILLENAGAEKGFLILVENSELKIQAAGTINNEKVEVLQSIPIHQSPSQLSIAIVNYVVRTHENIVLTEALQEDRFADDPYINQHQPKSILCAPIIHQGQLTGLIYLENNLISGAFTPDRLEILKVLSSQIAISIENALLYRTLERKVAERTTQLAQANQEITALNDRLKAENLRMKAELDITRQLQKMLLPHEQELNQIAELDMVGFMEPAREVGGDYYDVLQYEDEIKIGIGDVTGHGLASGALALMVQTAVRTLQESEETDPVKFFTILNRTIYHNVQRMNTDKTLTLSLLDYKQGQLRLCGQHEEVLLVRQQGQIERIDTIELGFPIGLEEEISQWVKPISIALELGDGIVLYTDGITEAENHLGEQYGLERLCQMISQNWQLSALYLQEIILDDVWQHIGRQKVFDDMTLLIFKRKK